ncbi:NmrA family transcriptional regulator [Amycolatopsis sp. NBRC 101858]|uniref:NmrA family transcriptional regulator n=1 Tax=Amycolatopsis sp. NBRC 101858 TaxID=3032200 RepID=UPI0024A07452|nr:NmrA family transcriptional regulator [Amycolatopsis sp. NBRC 101858]GLY44601.1 NmrA family transcriptional regulator [Amycolatopsis sp. NBRC 101858]
MTTLILGGTGKTGRRVAQRVDHARIASRRTGFDLGDPSSWALDGVTAVYLVEPDLQAGPRLPRFVTEAVAAGARRLVLLSAPRASEEGHPLHAAERAVRESGVGWTILHPNWFAQNFSEGPWAQGIRDGVLTLPTGDGRAPFVDAEDIAELAAAALTGDRHDGEVYELTGPRAVSFGEAVSLIARAAGRGIEHADVDPEAFVERQTAYGVPLPVARLLTGLLTDLRDGRGADLGDGVERALGRPPRSFEEFVAGTSWT